MGANLFQTYLQPPRSVLDYQGDMDARDLRVEQLKNAQGNNQLLQITRQQQMQASQQAQAKQNALQQVLSDPSLVTIEAKENAMLRHPLLMDLGMAAQKQRLENADKVSQTKERDVKAAGESNKLSNDKRQQALQHILAFGSPDEAIASLQSAKDIPDEHRQAILQSLQATGGDPMKFLQWQNRLALSLATPEQQAKGLAPSLEKTGGAIVPVNQVTGQAMGAGVPITQSPDSIASNATQRRGQDLMDARTREAAEATVTKPFEVTDPTTGQPTLVRQDKAGNITPVPGYQPKGMGTTKLTEDQSNATRFAARMKDASKIVDAMEEKGVSGSDLRTKAAGNEWTNFLASSDGQQYRQAQENWVTANLRKESGAAIGKDEMAKDVAKWFPKIGDGKEVKAQKAAARRVAEEGMLVSAGPGSRQVQGILDRSAEPKAETKTGAYPDADKEARYQAWKKAQK